MNETEIKQLEKWTKGLLGDGYDLFDLKANQDTSISIGENKTILRNKLKVFLKEELTAKDVKNEKEVIEHDKIKEINETIEETEKEFKESLKHIDKNSGVLDKLYYLPKEYVKVVADKNNDIHGLILSGMAGTSKSFSTIQSANELDCNYSYFSGFTTPLSLFRFLQEHKDDDLIIIDDTISIFKNFQATTLLLNALHSNTDKRKVTWNSTKLKDAASEFIIEANLVLIINELPKNIGKSLLNSRCLTYEFNFTNFEILTIMKAIADIPHKRLSKEERHKVLSYISDHVDESSTNFDLRVQNKVENLYLYSKEKWKELSAPLLNTKDEKLSLLREFIRSSTTLKEAQERFVDSTGLTPRQTRRYVAKLKGGVDSLH